MGKGYACIGLHAVKDRLNVGSALRAAHAFDAAWVATSGCRYRKAPTDTMATFRKMPMMEVADLRTIIPYDCVPVAVDLVPGAIPLQDYRHPDRAFYIFGPEDGTLGRAVTEWCRDVIYVPTAICLNLAACVNVILYDRATKRNEWPDAAINPEARALV